jgi:hypothetical protein
MYDEKKNKTNHCFLALIQRLFPSARHLQVHVLEDEESGTSFRNLNIHRVNNEEEALNLVSTG